MLIAYYINYVYIIYIIFSKCLYIIYIAKCLISNRKNNYMCMVQSSLSTFPAGLVLLSFLYLKPDDLI